MSNVSTMKPTNKNVQETSMPTKIYMLDSTVAFVLNPECFVNIHIVLQKSVSEIGVVHCCFSTSSVTSPNLTIGDDSETCSKSGLKM